MPLEVLTDLTTVAVDDLVEDVDIVTGSVSIRRKIALRLEETMRAETATARCRS